MIHLITGYAGYEHIKSADDGAFNAAIFGDGQYVMNTGNQFAASIIDNNTVRILDGDGLMYGRHFRIEPNSYEDVTITTGTAGKNRVDLICMTYKKNETDGTEQAYIEVIKGTETEGAATVPEYTAGNILEGATFNQMPLYKVNIEGVVLSGIEQVFDLLGSSMIKFDRKNPIKNKDDDTVANWAAIGSGLYFFDEGGQVTSRPSEYGFVFNLATPSGEVAQQWIELPQGRIWRRSGNSYGFNNDWTEMVDANGVNFKSRSIGLSDGAVQLIGTDEFAAVDIYYTDTDNIEKFRRLMFQNNGNLVEEFWKADTSVCYGTNVFAKGKKLLWQNASPTTGMGAQTINLDLSEYDMVMVECYLTASITLRINAFAEITDGTKNGFLASGVYGTNNKIYGLYRPMYVTKTGIELGNSYATTPSSDENVSTAAIPYKIYGIKGVQ